MLFCSHRRNTDLVFADADKGVGMLLFTDLGSSLGIHQHAGTDSGDT